MLNTFEVGKLLGIPRKDVVALMHEGHLPFKVRNGNYLTTESDVLLYRAARNEKREKKLENVYGRD